MARTTIAVQVSTRDLISEAAKANSESIDAFLVRLLEESRRHEFWKAIDEMDPDEYEAALVEDGDVEFDYTVEDARIDADEAAE